MYCQCFFIINTLIPNFIEFNQVNFIKKFDLQNIYCIFPVHINFLIIQTIPKQKLLGIINSLLWTNISSLEGIIWPKVLRQIAEIKDNLQKIENTDNDLWKIHFNSDDTIDDFQINIYLFDGLLSNHSIKSEVQLDALVKLLDDMLDYITNNKDIILALESIKLTNIKNSFRAIQTIINHKITFNSKILTQLIDVYSLIIPSLLLLIQK